MPTDFSMNTHETSNFKSGDFKYAWLCAAACISFFLLYFFALVPAGGSYFPYLLWISFLTCIVALYYCFVSKVAHPALFLILLYSCLFYLGPGLIHTAIGVFPFFGSSYQSDAIFDASCVIFIFIFCFIASYFYFFRLHAKRSAAKLTILRSQSSFVGVIVLLIFGAMACSVLIGFDLLLQERGDFLDSDLLTPGQLMLLNTARITGFFSVLYAALNFNVKRNGWSLILLIFGLVIFVLTNNPLAIPRFLLGGYVLTFIFVFFDINPRRRLYLFFGFFLAQISLFPMLSELARGDIELFFQTSTIEYLSAHGDFDGLQSTINIVKMSSEQGFEYGRQITSAALFAVPRSYWPEKSIGTGGEAGYFMGYPFVNLSAPLPAEFYIDFGYFGLILFSLAFSYFCSRIDVAYGNMQKKNFHLGLVFPSVFYGYLFILMRGALVGVVGPVFLSLFVVLLVNKLIFSRGESAD